METIIKNIRGRAVPKPENGQNTDDILPAEFLKEITFSNMGSYLYYYERFNEGMPVEGHPLNREEFKGASILIAGSNFGCGSSREHAPQALKRYGIRAIVAESLAEIFAGNCASLGVVGVTVPAPAVRELAEKVGRKPDIEIDIDLEEKALHCDDMMVKLDLPEGRRQAFLKGTWDALTVLQKSEEGIKALEENLSYLKFA